MPTPDSIAEDLGINPAAWARFCERVGHNPSKAPKFLDKGSMGSVYKLDTGRALKLTRDDSEANAAAVVMRNPDPVIYTVTEVVRIKSDAGIYAIVGEMLLQPEPQWEKFAQMWGNKFHIKNRAAVTDANIALFLEDLSPKDIKTFAPQIRWFRELSAYLARVGILFYDMHDGNIMRRKNGTHCAIDLGVSRSPKQSIPEASLQVLTSDAVEHTFVLKMNATTVDAIDHMVKNLGGSATEQDVKSIWGARRSKGDYITIGPAEPDTWSLFSRLCDAGYKMYDWTPLKALVKKIEDGLAGKKRPSKAKPRPSKAKPVMTEIQIAGITVKLKGFDAGDESDVKDLHHCQSIIERSVRKIRTTFGVKAWPTVELDFKSMPPAQGTYYPGLTKLVLWAKGNNSTHIEEGIKTFVHEYGHFIMNSYVDQKARKAWIDLVEADKVSVSLKTIGAAWREGEGISQFLDRLKEEDPLLAIKAEYILLYHNKPKKLMTREDMLKSTKEVRLSQHPVTPYGHTDPEEAFCEAFGNFIAYGPRTVHPLVISWMRLILPESTVHASIAKNLNSGLASSSLALVGRLLAIARSLVSGPASDPEFSSLAVAPSVDLRHDAMKEWDKIKDTFKDLKEPPGNPISFSSLGLKPDGGVQNILKVYSRATPEERAFWGSWYRDASGTAQAMAAKYDLPLDVVAGVIAVLSPGNLWWQNVKAADKLILFWKEGILRSLPNLNAYPAFVRKAIKILDTYTATGEMDQSLVASPKVEPFFQSLVDPEGVSDRVVLDGHMLNVWAGIKRPLKGRASPTKEQHAKITEDFRTAAQKLGISPQALQATVWYVFKQVVN